MTDTEWELDKQRCWERFHRWLVAERNRLRTEEPAGFEKVLALWISLQNAMFTRKTHSHAGQICIPWECVDKDVHRAWMRLTAPENALALENLFYQMPEGPQMELARKALEFSRKRRNMHRGRTC